MINGVEGCSTWISNWILLQNAKLKMDNCLGHDAIPQYKFVGEVVDFDQKSTIFTTIRQRNIINEGDQVNSGQASVILNASQTCMIRME